MQQVEDKGRGMGTRERDRYSCPGDKGLPLDRGDSAQRKMAVYEGTKGNLCYDEVLILIGCVN